MKTFEPLTDIQWENIKHLLPAPLKRGRGKPHAPWRPVLNSILFVLLTRAKWGSWPKTPDFASKSAAHRWYVNWDKNGLLQQILEIVQGLQPGCEISMPQRRIHTLREETDPTEEAMDLPLYLEIEKPEPAMNIGIK